VSSRSTLLAGTPLDLRKRPAEVRLIDVHGLTARWHPKTDACPTEFVGPLMRLLDSLDGSVAVLAPSNANVYGIRIASRGRLRVYEGVDFPRAHEALAAAEAVQGNPHELSLSILDFVRSTCTGLQQKMVDDCAAALLADRIQLGRKRAVLPLVERFAQLYKDPSIHGWAAVIRGILEEPPLGIKVHLADTLRVAGLVDVSDGLPAPVALERVIRSRKENCGLPRRFTTTIHKAKGREVDHVIVVPVTKSAFNSTEGARRLLYVAMSRARKTVTLVQDPKSPSPLLCR
jgi:UvrD-like helicase C-terminal domain